MKVKIDENYYRVDFHYTHEPRANKNGTLSAKPVTTTCYIYTATDDNKIRSQVAIESAHCSLKDNFCRATGRKISFTKALRKAFPSFEGQKMRTAFWKVYSEQIGFKKNQKGNK